jgi:hypothetical protein
MGQLHLAQLARTERNLPQTDKERTRVWSRWLAYLASIQRSDDPFLKRLDKTELAAALKPVVIGGFAQALRSGELQQRGKKSVVGQTVRGNLDTLVQTFRDNRQKNPTLDPDGRFSSILSWQIAGYKSLDPGPNRQKAISVHVLTTMQEIANDAVETAAADLAMGAFFFACRSCEYSSVKGPRRTKTLRIGDIQFRRGRHVLPHDPPDLHLAEQVSVVFRDQKNRHKMATRTAWRTSNPLASPVAAWANITRRVRATPGCTNDTLVFKYTSEDGKGADVTSDIIVKLLRRAATKIGFATLGYAPRDIGTHSIRSGAAMALALSGHQAWRIMLAGRWRSSAFLLYIREQVQAFSKGVADRMIENPDFFHVPDIDSPSDSPTVSPLEANIFSGGASSNCTMLDISFLG